MTKIKVRGKWFVDEEILPTRERVEPVASEPEEDSHVMSCGNRVTLTDATKHEAINEPRVITALHLLKDCGGFTSLYDAEERPAARIDDIIEAYNNKPFTPDDAIALLVREGWVDMDDAMVFRNSFNVERMHTSVRVLIAPTAERE